MLIRHDSMARNPPGPRVLNTTLGAVAGFEEMKTKVGTARELKYVQPLFDITTYDGRRYDSMSEDEKKQAQVLGLPDSSDLSFRKREIAGNSCDVVCAEALIDASLNEEGN